MKTSIKSVLFTVLISLVFLVPVFFGCSATQVVTAPISGGYKCFAELYPEKARQSKTPALGEIVTDNTNGKQYRVMAEAANPEKDEWVQWIDIGPMDNICNYAVFIYFTEGGDVNFLVADCDGATEIIKEDCAKEGRNIDDIIHHAEPIGPGINI